MVLWQLGIVGGVKLVDGIGVQGRDGSVALSMQNDGSAPTADFGGQHAVVAQTDRAAGEDGPVDLKIPPGHP